MADKPTIILIYPEAEKSKSLKAELLESRAKEVPNFIARNIMLASAAELRRS